MVWKRRSRMLTQLSCALLLVALGCFFLPQTSWAIGLEVDPGEIVIKDIPLGEVVKVSELGGEKMKLRIENKGGSAYTYTIDILPTSDTTSKLKEGYRDIPDISWIWPENKEVRIAGKSSKEVELYLKIPKTEEYYNKKYQAIIEVKSKKERPQDLFVLACQLRMSFSTVLSKKEQAKLKIQRKREAKLKIQRKRGDRYPRSITIIKTGDKWTEDPSFLSQLKKEFPYSKIKEIDYSSKRGKRLVEKLGIDFLPACIFSKDIEKNKRRFAKLSKSNLIQQGNYYLWSSTNRTGIFIKRKRQPHTLEVFGMSQCPFSIPALEKIIGAKKDGRLPEDFQLNCHYIATTFFSCEDPTKLEFRSLHGQPEIEEDIRQLCIKKYHLNKFFDYLLLRNKDVENADWQTLAKEAGIDIEVIEKCISEEGETLLLEEIDKTAKLSITSSPTFLYENRILIVGFNLELLKELPGLEGL